MHVQHLETHVRFYHLYHGRGHKNLRMDIPIRLLIVSRPTLASPSRSKYRTIFVGAWARIAKAKAKAN